MGTLTIRGLDDKVIESLKARARTRRRSLEAELRELLSQAARQPLVLDPLAEADRIAAMTPRDRPQTEERRSCAQEAAMIVVVDPGVAIKWFVEEPLRPQARSLLVHGHELIGARHPDRGRGRARLEEGRGRRDRARPGRAHRAQHRPAGLHLGLRRIDPPAQPRPGAGPAMRPAGARLLLRRLRRGGSAHRWSAADETFLQALRLEGIALRGVPLARIHELADA